MEKLLRVQAVFKHKLVVLPYCPPMIVKKARNIILTIVCCIRDKDRKVDHFICCWKVGDLRRSMKEFSDEDAAKTLAADAMHESDKNDAHGSADDKEHEPSSLAQHPLSAADFIGTAIAAGKSVGNVVRASFLLI